MARTHFTIRAIVHIIFPVFAGVCIYALFRGIPVIDPTSAIFPLCPNKPSGWILYNLPDGLWFYALISSLALVWQDSHPKQLIGWLLIPIALSYLTEILQAKHLIPGTFDWYDLLTYTLTIIVFLTDSLFLQKKTNS